MVIVTSSYCTCMLILYLLINYVSLSLVVFLLNRNTPYAFFGNVELSSDFLSSQNCPDSLR